MALAEIKVHTVEREKIKAALFMAIVPINSF